MVCQDVSYEVGVTLPDIASQSISGLWYSTIDESPESSHSKEPLHRLIPLSEIIIIKDDQLNTTRFDDLRIVSSEVNASATGYGATRGSGRSKRCNVYAESML